MKNLIKIHKGGIDWKDAIRVGTDLLVENKIATSQLAEEIINSTNDLGPYYILLPRLAMAHTRPGEYNLKPGMSLVVFKDTVKFSSNPRHDVNVLFTLSAIDDNSHIDILSKMAIMFNSTGNENLINKAMECNNEEELYEIFKELFN